jgi:thioredoxin 1
MPTVTVTDATFQRLILEARDLVLVDFWAEWCGPCHAIAPFLEEIANEQAGSVTIAKLDVEANPEVAAAYDIVSVPTFKLFKQGAVVAEDVGAIPKSALEALIREGF